MAVTAALAAAGALVGAGGGAAGAAPKPTVAQVQQRLRQLNARADRLGQQFDQVLTELASAKQRLGLVNAEAARYQRTFDGMRAEIGRIAAVAYEQGGVGPSVALLTSGSPQQILNQSSILTELSSANSAQLRLYLAASRQLLGAQRAARQTEQGIAVLKRGLAKRRAGLHALIAQQQSLLAQLSPPQQSGLGPGAPPGGGGGYNGPTRTQAQKAVAFAYGQLGCPYMWGGTGPCNAGFDCSGLVMSAWAHAGVSIPRTSYAQWTGLTHVSTSALQPGDILVYAGASHVGIYVGGNYLIDAPVPGQNVEKVALSGWYSSELIGAVRP